MTHLAKQKTKYSGVDWIGHIPEKWKVQRLKTIIQTTKNGAWGDDPKGDSNDVVCIRVADFDKQNFGVSLDNLTLRNIEDYEKLLLKRNDLVFEKSGGGDLQLVGRIVLFNQDIKAVTSNFLSTIRLREDFANPNYFYYLLKYFYDFSINYKSIKQTTGIQNIDADAYFQELVPVPDLYTQKVIADYLCSKTEQVKKFIDDKRRLIELLDEQKRTIIYDCITKGIDKNIKTRTSSIDWLKNIPDGWVTSKIKYLCYVKGRIGFHGLNSEEFSNNKNLPYLVTGTDFIDQKVNWETCYHIPKERYEEDPYIQLKENDLLITKDGTIGKTAIVKGKPDCATLNSGIMVVRPNERLLSEYLKYVLNSKYFTFFTDLLYQGSTIKHLYQEDFNNLTILLPDILTQKKIIDYLNKETFKIDNAIGTIKKEIELVEEYKRSLIYQAVTGKIETLLK